MKKLGKAVCTMILCTVFMAVAVFAAVTQAVSTTSNIAFTADKNVEAVVEVLVNGISKGSVSFAANEESAEKSIAIGNLVTNNWVDPDVLGTAYIEKRITVTIVITNNSDKSAIGVHIITTGTVDSNCSLTTTAGNTSVTIGESTTYAYVFDVKDINENVNSFDYSWAVTLEQAQ